MKRFTAYPMTKKVMINKQLEKDFHSTAKYVVDDLINATLTSDSMYDSDKYTQYWLEECARVSELFNGSSKRLTSQFVLNATWGNVSRDLESTISSREQNYRTACPVDHQTLSMFIESYFEWVANEVGNTGKVLQGAAHRQLKQLFREYIL